MPRRPAAPIPFLAFVLLSASQAQPWQGHYAVRQSSIRSVANKPIVQSNLSLNAFHRSADRMVEIIRQHLTQHHYILNRLGDRRYRRRSCSEDAVTGILFNPVGTAADGAAGV
jgi:hypothetical protein